jgi:3-deoxy-D-manno-octulosonic-acid transferase
VLVRAIRAGWPGRPIVVTASTATGRRRAEELLGAIATVRFLPYDLPGAVARFLDALKPPIGVILETELWPHLYAGCRQRGIPILLASARLSARSVRGYARIGGLVREMLGGDVTIAAQSSADAERFLALGAAATKTHVSGNLKFDYTPADDAAQRAEELRAQLGRERPVWVAGSTHDGEDRVVLAAHRHVRATHPDALLVLAPRHPQRFAAVAEQLAQQGWRYVRRSSGEPVASDTEVLLLDTLGELARFYGSGDVAFVGGSLVPVGGHNLLEPAALARPIVAGPSTENDATTAHRLGEAGAVVTVSDAVTLGGQVLRWVDDPEACQRAGAAGRQVVEQNRGALGRVLELLAARVPPST